MSRKYNFRSQIRASRRISDRRELARFAKAASQNAKRSSIALNIPFEIIKDGGIYKFIDGKMVKISSIRKVESVNSGLTKGSKICLK
ncbi:hypothetical protein [uncultured Chryseobacterium sp.]|uniref:hypothetical protein n=1 Tax=uncultured Chryseobacterium sp. TaxID=259322 RepID=UPI0025EF45DB|nr:hypothetical protein [uncultured Chryseobacterium sp.]